MCKKFTCSTTYKSMYVKPLLIIIKSKKEKHKYYNYDSFLSQLHFF